MNALIYILHSQKLQRFYTGSTQLGTSERLEMHLTKYYGNNKFTARADDWTLVLSIECANNKQAQAIERHIKNMKSAKYINNLKTYPEIIQKLLGKYKN